MAASGYLHEEDIAKLLGRQRERLLQMRETLQQVQGSTSHSDLNELDLCKSQLDAVEIDAELSLIGVPLDSVGTLRSAFGALAEAMQPEAALDMIETILRRLSDKL